MHSKFLEFFIDECRARGINAEFTDDNKAEWRIWLRMGDTAGIKIAAEITDESEESEAMLGLYTLHMMVLFPFMSPDVAERYQAAAVVARARLREYFEAARNIVNALQRAHSDGVA